MADVYRYKRDVDNVEVFAVDPTGTISLGDLVRWNTSTKKAERLAAVGNASSLLGVAEGRIPIASGIDNAPNLENQLTVRKKGIFSFKTTAAEVYSHGDAVKRGADDQTVSKATVGTDQVGYVDLPDGVDVTGAAGVEVTVLITQRFPSNDVAD